MSERYPKIVGPCPLRFDSAPEPGRDYCSHCERRVVNLDALAAAARAAFLAGCTGKVCVSYAVPRRRTVHRLAAQVALAAAIASAPAAMAEDVAEEEVLELVMLVGGIEPDREAAWVDADAAAEAALPTVAAGDLLRDTARFIEPPQPDASPQTPPD